MESISVNIIAITNHEVQIHKVASLNNLILAFSLKYELHVLVFVTKTYNNGMRFNIQEIYYKNKTHKKIKIKLC